MPYEELQHTADWSLRVWAADITSLFVEAAKGMYALAGIKLTGNPRVKRKFTSSAQDVESMLVSFLTELVYFIERDNLAFDYFDPNIDLDHSIPFRMSTILRGARIQSMDKAIKAVTFHNLRIKHTGRGYEVEIVFDV